MDFSIPIELEELVLCSCCHLPFNDNDSIPKLFSCRHFFCLKCTTTVLLKGHELYCIHCWKRTEPPDMKPESLPTNNSILYILKNMNALTTNNVCTKRLIKSCSKTDENSTSGSVGISNKISMGENCLTHAMPNSLWCLKCNIFLCRACSSTDEHRNHSIKANTEAKDIISNDIANEILSMQNTLSELQQFVFKQRDYLLKVLEACIALKTQVEAELIDHLPTYEVADIKETISKAKVCLSMIDQQSPVEAFKLLNNLNIEKQRLHFKHSEMRIKCKLDDLVYNYISLFDFDTIKQAILKINTPGTGPEIGTNLSASGPGHGNPYLLLANYTIFQLYSRHTITSKNATRQLKATNGSDKISSLIITNQLSNNESLVSPTIHCNDSILSKRLMELNQLTKTFQGNFGQILEPTKNSCGSMRTQPLVNLFVPDINGISLQQIPQSFGQQSQSKTSGSPTTGSTALNTNVLVNPTLHIHPIYFFNIEINGQSVGRILIEVRNDVAPKMAKNFDVLTTV
ncbi:uncharacterized protein LOC134827783 isoform X2 [Culicoides brevitarsis]|uniref:uncharacterized protein LOC134827783 isoform X2 n=1 Tax=Culicoides brevitarsis TaxID=469753 RepID=UPI00307B389F